MGTVSGPDFRSSTEVANRCVFCGTRVTIRFFPLLCSVEFEVSGNFCDKCSHLETASVQAAGPEQFYSPAHAHGFSLGRDTADPRVSGRLLGVELRWVESTSAERAHFSKTYFEATVPAAPGASPGSPGSSTRRPEDHGGLFTEPAAPAPVRDGQPGLTGNQGAAQDDELSDDHASGIGSAAGSHRRLGEDADAAPTPEEKERYDHRAETAKTVVDLFESGLKEHLADQLAERLGDKAFEIINGVWTPEHCEVLAALADKLDQLHALIRNGIASGVRIVVRWAGASDFTAALIGELVATSVSAHFLYPLKGFAELLRVTGTVCCTACGCAESCACARSLTRDLFIRYLKWLFGLEIDRVSVSAGTDKIVGPGLYFTYEYLKNSGSDDGGGAHWEHRADDEEFWGPGWRRTSQAWFGDFTENPNGPGGSAAQPRTGPADDASLGAGSPSVNPYGRTAHDDDRAARPADTGHQAAAPTVGTVTEVREVTGNNPSEPPPSAVFGHG
jgi:hypothetical protein